MSDIKFSVCAVKYVGIMNKRSVDNDKVHTKERKLPLKFENQYNTADIQQKYRVIKRKATCRVDT